MASEYYIKERRYNGTDYDTLYPTATPTDGMVKTANGKSAIAVSGVDYQAVLTAGKNIEIENDVISATGGLLPKIIVTAPTGSTVTASKDGEIESATEVSGTWTFNLPSLGTWTVRAVRGGESTSDEIVVDSVQVYTLELFYIKIYGVHWDGAASTALTRTDDAALFPNPNPYYVGMSGTPSSPFDSLYPWNGMVRSTDPEAGELVSIPKFWFKIDIASDNSMDIKIADAPVNGFMVSPAHADRGDGKGERDVVYVGRYHCASNYKSSSSSTPLDVMHRNRTRTDIHALGSNIWQFDFAMRQTIQLLYLVEFANWDSQDKIGYGGGNDSSKEQTGVTDSMPYHTGTMQSSRTTYGVGVQYRYIEDFWGNVFDWIDGCYYNENGLNIIMNPNDFSNLENGVLIGVPSSGYPTAMGIATVNNVQWMYPVAGDESGEAYIPDYYYYTSSLPCLTHGGDWRRSDVFGIFCSYASYGGNYAPEGVGCRLMKLP